MAGMGGVGVGVVLEKKNDVVSDRELYSTVIGNSFLGGEAKRGERGEN